MRIPVLFALLQLIASPAAALLLDQEPSNDDISTATIQIFPSGGETAEVGRFALDVLGGDTDYVGIDNLVPGDVVTVSTTPMGDPPNFESPDTIAGLFDSSGTQLCIQDDAFNNDLDSFPTGFGSLCRYEIAVAGNYYVGITGWSSVPFDGNHFEQGIYSVTVTVSLPEPSLVLQLGAGLLGLAMLDRRRRARSRSALRARALPARRGALDLVRDSSLATLYGSHARGGGGRIRPPRFFWAMRRVRRRARGDDCAIGLEM